MTQRHDEDADLERLLASAVVAHDAALVVMRHTAERMDRSLLGLVAVVEAIRTMAEAVQTAVRAHETALDLVLVANRDLLRALRARHPRTVQQVVRDVAARALIAPPAAPRPRRPRRPRKRRR